MTLPAYAMNTSSFPDNYERFLVGPLFRPWAEILVDRARLKAGERVLDVACVEPESWRVSRRSDWVLTAVSSVST